LQGEDDNDSEVADNRRRRGRSKHRDSDDEEEDHKARSKKPERRRKDDVSKDQSKDRSHQRTRKDSEELDRGDQDTSFNKDEELIPSPRDKVGLPIDLSWRHMTKAERRRLEMARMKLDQEEEK